MSTVQLRRAGAGVLRWAVVVCLACAAAACPGSSPSTPTPTPQPAGPTITAVTPSSGSTAGGSLLTIAGTSFSGTPAVTIGGVPATNVQLVSANSITAVTPAHAAGAVDVVVVVALGTATLTQGFTYVAPPAPAVTAITPVTGSTAGGTAVTITGTNFMAPATVTVGGVAATGVEVVSATTIRAVTGARSAGAADVVVTAGTLSGTLPGAFTYVAPVVNPLPVIRSLTVQGTRTNEPANFADVGEEVVVTATVVDNETPITGLLFEWTADGGTFTGTGPSVRWKAPTALVTPSQLQITLRVTEPLEDGGDGRAGAAITQSVTATTTVRVHNSVKEISDLSVQFLLDFSDSNLAPAFVVRNFWDGCQGKFDELSDVENNRKNYVITSYRVDQPTSATIAFQGTCPFRSKKGDGCVQTPTMWKSIYKPTGRSETTTGVDQTTAVYRESRWWLCDSDFNGSTTNPITAVPFIR